MRTLTPKPQSKKKVRTLKFETPGGPRRRERLAAAKAAEHQALGAADVEVGDQDTPLGHSFLGLRIRLFFSSSFFFFLGGGGGGVRV